MSKDLPSAAVVIGALRFKNVRIGEEHFVVKVSCELRVIL